MRPLGLSCFIPVLLGVIGLDQYTKWLIQHFFILYESREVYAGFFNLVYYTNNGAAFSMFAGQPTLWRQVFFIGVSVAALIAILFAYRRYARINGWYTVALALISGGAAGNLIDRLRLGCVVDFLDFYFGRYHWPAFNIADSAITVGVGLFLLVSIFSDHRQGAKP
ncbi:MAG: signal peptidase II [Desulfobulbus propionicus]|nr:MAG: signal peptidase II [Desulfobulbus propionicus]